MPEENSSEGPYDYPYMISSGGGGGYKSPVNEYRIFIWEISPFENEKTKILRENEKNIAEWTGDEILYLSPVGLTNIENIADMLGLEIAGLANPTLIISDKLPEEMEKGDKIIKYELGNIESSAQVTQQLQIVFSKLQEDDFMNALTWDKRKKKLENALSVVTGGFSDILTTGSAVGPLL